jgi:hypothetical protein
MREARVKTHQLNAIRPVATRYSHRVGSVSESIMGEGMRRGVSISPKMQSDRKRPVMTPRNILDAIYTIYRISIRVRAMKTKKII